MITHSHGVHLSSAPCDVCDGANGKTLLLGLRPSVLCAGRMFSEIESKLHCSCIRDAFDAFWRLNMT
jgi:hypothetical protein